MGANAGKGCVLSCKEVGNSKFPYPPHSLSASSLGQAGVQQQRSGWLREVQSGSHPPYEPGA